MCLQPGLSARLCSHPLRFLQNASRCKEWRSEVNSCKWLVGCATLHTTPFLQNVMRVIVDATLWNCGTVVSNCGRQREHSYVVVIMWMSVSLATQCAVTLLFTKVEIKDTCWKVSHCWWLTKWPPSIWTVLKRNHAWVSELYLQICLL